MNTQKLFQKNFTLAVIGQIISLFGNAILRFALPLYLLRVTNSPVLFGIVTACSFLPMIVLSFLGGILADRVNKRNIMVVLDFLTAGIIFALFLSIGTLPLVPLLIVVLMLLYGISGTYQPTVQASTPILIVETLQMSDELLGFSQGALALGGLCGGIFTAVFSKKLKLTNSHILLFLCCLSVAVIAIPLMLGLPSMVCYIVITAAGFVIMGLSTMFSVQMIAAVQTETPPELIGKVIALMMSLSMCAQPIGQAIYGVVFDKFQNHTGSILLCAAVLSAIIAIMSKRLFKRMDEI